MHPRLLALLLAAPLTALAGPAAAVTIDWVLVGDPGNAADTATNCYAADCGSVGYEYSISRYEVTNAQYAEFLNAKAASDPLELYDTRMGTGFYGDAQGGITRSGSSGSYTYAVKPGFADKPVNFVSFYDSLRFTNWLNNGQGSADTETGAYTLLGGTVTPSNGSTVVRNPGANIFLPSENEWYKAAYFNGTTYLDYPAGTDTQTVCAAAGATANTANCHTVVGNVTDVGAYTGSASPYGTFDQGGNVGEWNEWMPLTPGVRGGEWVTGAAALAASDRVGTLPSFEIGFIGFRVASLVPEPDGSLLAMLGLAGLAARRRT
jgi:formylglycine-generating enzyme required for sulfatase activity